MKDFFIGLNPSDNNANISVQNTLPNNYTVEGTIDELPTFIESLENKICATPVTFKLSEDGQLGNMPLLIPPCNIPEIIIDGNEKTLTADTNFTNNYIGFPSDDWEKFDPTNYNAYTGKKFATYNKNKTVIIKNLTIDMDTEKTQIVRGDAPINLVLENSTFVAKVNVVRFHRNINVTIEGCEINNKTSNNGWAIYMQSGSHLYSFNNVLKGGNAGINVGSGAIAKSIVNTVSSPNAVCRIYRGGLATAISAQTTLSSQNVTGTTFSSGISVSSEKADSVVSQTITYQIEGV